jgi:hypothetical protein
MMRRALFLGILVAVVAAACAGTASAGTYTVYACDAAGTLWDNRAWSLTEAANGIAADQGCAARADNIGLNNGGGRTASGGKAVLEFLSPKGTTVTDFRLKRRFIFTNPTPDGAHRYYEVGTLGGIVYEGAGYYANAVRNPLNAQKRWYGYPQDNADTGIQNVSRASFPALAAYKNDSRSLAVRIGCYGGSSPCDVAGGGHLGANILGAEVDVTDPSPPANLVVDSSGLFSGGQVNGSDVAKVKVSDPSGIRRLEIVDVTGGGATVVGSEDYSTDATTDKGATCSFRFAAPCPQLGAGETIRATALAAGHRQLVVRAIDSGNNVAQSPAKDLDVVTPSDRGAANGDGATEGGKVTARFLTGSHKTKRTIGFNSKAPIRGRLYNDAGQPVPHATVAVLTRDLDDNDAKLRAYVRTGDHGYFYYKATAYASRLYQFAWASHVNDSRYSANGYVTLRARATATLKAGPSRPRVGQKVTLTGRLAGKRPRRSVDIVAQGRAPGGGYRTFADGHVGKSGRFRLTYRFQNPSSRGHRFEFRIKIERDTGYAYYGGHSHTARVTVR